MDNGLLLKPGAQGMVILEGEDAETPVTGGLAGSARKGAIDIAGMQCAMHNAATERWKRAAPAKGARPWEPFQTILKRLETQPFTHELHSAALKQWAAQPAVKAILDDRPSFPDSAVALSAQPSSGIAEASITDTAVWAQMTETERRAAELVWNNHTHYAIDPLARPLDEYVQRFGLCDLLGYGEVIHDFERIAPFDETALFASLPDETLITLARVHY